MGHGACHFEVAVGDIALAVDTANQPLLELSRKGLPPQHRWAVIRFEPDSSHASTRGVACSDEERVVGHYLG
jgi:hypothetical protein